MSLDAYLAASAALIERTRRELDPALVEAAVAAVVAALQVDRPLLVCGNGGSAADAMHLTAELVGRFRRERRGLRCICLADNAAVLTAWANDYGFETVFARQVEAYGEPGAVLLGISTSGRSANVVAAFRRARESRMVTVALTGAGGGELGALADHLLAVPSAETPLIQQVHLCLFHYLCERVETALA